VVGEFLTVLDQLILDVVGEMHQLGSYLEDDLHRFYRLLLSLPLPGDWWELERR
jgi:hypothetical protein